MTPRRTFSGFRQKLIQARKAKTFPLLVLAVASPIIYLGLTELLTANNEHEEYAKNRWARVQIQEPKEPVGRNMNEPDNPL